MAKVTQAENPDGDCGILHQEFKCGVQEKVMLQKPRNAQRKKKKKRKKSQNSKEIFRKEEGIKNVKCHKEPLR